MLELDDVGARRQADVAALVDACVGHATLRHLVISVSSRDGGEDDPAAAAEVGAALARLVSSQPFSDLLLDFASTPSLAQTAPMWEAVQRRALCEGGKERVLRICVDGTTVCDQAAMDALAAEEDEEEDE